MKKVVLLKSRSGNRGGLEKYAARIAEAFVKKGANVTILTTGEPTPSNIPIISAKTLPWPAFFRMEQFDRFTARWLAANPVDLVFGMDRNRFQTHMRAGNGVHAAYLDSRKLTEGHLKSWMCRCNPLHRKILSLEKAAFENPKLEKLFTNSFMVREQVLKYYRVDSSKIQVIHNGVEWGEMETDFHASQEEKRDRFHFLFIGNGYLRKGLDRLLIALSLLKSREFTLSVIGKDNAIDLYRAKAVQLGLKDHVHFLGPQVNIRPFYQQADCLVIPSFYDPFANVTVEALAMGLFVISSKCNGGREVLTQNNGTIIDDLLNPDAMVASLSTAMKQPRSFEARLAIRNSVKHLDFPNQLQLLIDSCYG